MRAAQILVFDLILNGTGLQVTELREHQPKCRIYLTQTKADLLAEPAYSPPLASGHAGAQQKASSPDSGILSAAELCSPVTFDAKSAGGWHPAGDPNSATSVTTSRPGADGKALHSSQRQPRAVTEAEVQEYAVSVGAQVCVTSARTGLGVQVIPPQHLNDHLRAYPHHLSYG